VQQRPSEKKTNSYLEDKFAAFMQSEAAPLRSPLDPVIRHVNKVRPPSPYFFKIPSRK